MGEVLELERGEANLTKAGVSWKYAEDFWTPTGIVVSFCHFRDLKDFHTDPGKPSEE